MVITDLNSRIPVVIPSRGVNAILKGNGLGGVQLLFLPQNAVLKITIKFIPLVQMGLLRKVYTLEK